MARSQIQNSEGALTGLPLTRWSVWLSVFFGLSYGAYYTATGLAVQQQADHFARSWLKEITKGNLEQAFYLTHKPPHSNFSQHSALRNEVEGRYNMTGDFDSAGYLSGFTHAEYVRLLQLARDQAKIESEGVDGWGYEEGGYVVRLAYRIQTPLARFLLYVTVGGVDSRSAAEPGRQWYVKPVGTGPFSRSGDNQPPIEFTPEGKALLSVRRSAVTAGVDWFELVRNGKLNEAYLRTVSADGKPRKLEPAGLLLRATGPAVASWFALVSLLQADKDNFWGVPGVKETALTEARKLLTPAQPGDDQPFQVARPSVQYRGWSKGVLGRFPVDLPTGWT